MLCGKLSPRPTEDELLNKVTGVLIFAKGLSRQSCLGTVHLAKPYLAIRAIFVDTTNIEATDLDLPEGQQDRLFKRRQNAEPAFLDSRDWEANRAECGAGPSSPPPPRPYRR